MPINHYKCNECDFEEDYVESISVPKSMFHPEICPQCNTGKLEKVFDMNNGSGGFDIVGYCYMNEYGKHNWKKNLNLSDQAKVLAGEKDPY
jgi:predicted nucleic acid-binding Zn ribbon protein